MAIVTLNQLLEAIRGGIGGLVIRLRPDGKLILSGAPRYRKRKGSAKQKAYRKHFREGTQYAKWADNEYPIYAELAESAVAKGKWKSAYNFALSDWLNPPVIHRIERAQGCIRVEATDNVMVTRVRVTVLDEAGTVLEKGEAVRGDGDWWESPSHADGKSVVAEAWDLPGHVTRFVL